MAEVDQTVVDEILAKATEDTEEGRLEKLEREVETLKGSIKRLLLDIRETMNKLENPFVNLQSLAEANIVPQSAPQIQIVPTNIPKAEEDKECEIEEQPKQEIEGKTEIMEDLALESEKIAKTKKEEEKMEFSSIKAPVQSLIDKKDEKIDKANLFKDKNGKMEFTTLFNLMEWVQSIVSRHSYEAFKLMLEVFEMTGYVNSNTKELIIKLADLVKTNGSKEVLIELYRLNRVFNPNDRSMDSDLISLLLEKR